VTAPLVRPKIQFDPIEVRAFETRTGRVAGVVPYVGDPKWSRGLPNVPGAWSVTVPLDTQDLSKDLLDAYSNPWKYSWCVSQGQKIWQAGPMVVEDYQGGFTSTIRGGGIWQLLNDKRLLINPARVDYTEVTPVDSDIAFGTTDTSDIGSAIPPANQNLSLHTIAKRIVQIMITAVSGDLPITFPADIAGTSERTYPGYDLASPGKRLSDLTQVQLGPEIEFSPEFVDPLTKQYVRWSMRIGNNKLGSTDVQHRWTEGKALISLGYTRDGSARCNLDFERGNGMNRDLIVGFYFLPVNPLDPSDMLLEDVGGAHTSATEVDTLDAWAKGAVTANLVPQAVVTAVVRVPGDDGTGQPTDSPPLTAVALGDTCSITLLRHPRLRAGQYKFRIIGMESAGTQLAKLTLQYLGMIT
jgi:hypothetical protein